MRNRLYKVGLSVIITLIVLLSAVDIKLYSQISQGLNPPSNQSYVAGKFVARNYLYTGVRINSGGGAANTTYSISLSSGSVKLPDGRTIVPFSSGGFNILGQPGSFPAIPISVGSGSTQETVTPTAVSGCYVGSPENTCIVTAAFTNAHGRGELVTSGTDGIQEAVNDAAYFGGGTVVADGSLAQLSGGAGSVRNIISGTVKVMPTVSIEDVMTSSTQYWNPVGGLTTLAAPATLVNATAGFSVAGANLTGGTYTGSSTYIACVAYVDIMGQEGPCSATFTIATSGSAATDQIGFTGPIASTGAVGYTIYITLASGSYNVSYKVPLATYSNGVMTSNGVCTGGLTTIETTTAACPVPNTSFGQVGSAAIVSALTLNTSPINPEVTTVSTTSIYVPNAGGRTTYAYAPSSRVGLDGVPSTFLPFTISAVDASTVPSVIGTINLRPGFMNTLGKTLEVCGYATTAASTGTVVDIQFQWDAIGQNTAGKGVLIGDNFVTHTSTSVRQLTFCQDFQTTVAAATATGGSLQDGTSFITSGIATTTAAGGQVVAGGNIASLNLNSETRLNIIYLHTTGTDGTAVTLQNVTFKLL